MSNPYESPDAPPTTLRAEWNPFAVFLIMVGAMLAYRFTIECATGFILVGLAAFRGEDLETVLADPSALLQTEIMALATIIQLGGMAAVVALVLRFAGWPVRTGLGIVTTRAGQYAAAFAGGGVVGFVASALTEPVRAIIPDALQLPSTNEMVIQSLTEGPLLGRALMLMAVTLAAPLFEELAFRGALWTVVERMVTGAASSASLLTARLLTLIITSLAFAAYHIDPVHVLALLPTAFFLGWLRYTSRSVWPGIVAHFVNNTLAAGLAIYGTDPSQGMTTPFLVLAIVLTLIAGVAASRLAEPEPS